MATPGDNLTAVDMNVTSNATAYASSPPISSPLSFLLYHKDLIILQTQLVSSALGIIYLGAHGALRRPPSAAPPDKTKKGRKSREPEPFTEGLQASDAILFPLLAGTVLVGLYYLIKWLQDPEILNKILRGYMSLASVASMGLLFTDTLHFLTSFVFPTVWTDMRGNVYRVDQAAQCQWKVYRHWPSRIPGLRPAFRSPLPGTLSHRFEWPSNPGSLWALRRTLKEEWTVRVSLHGLLKESFHVTLNGLIGLTLSLGVATYYHFTNSPTVSNMLGLGLSYGSFMVMSCTSFTVGSLVLIGLFFYDIVMVFYTPYMVTVATKLDAPIKLVFKAPGRASLLGLGDIVVPGIFICLALRFDLWRYYQKQVKYVDTELETEVKGDISEKSVTTTQVRKRAVKKPYINPQGQWGNRFWTLPVKVSPVATKGLWAAAFPKTYFYASMLGYTLGMLATLSMLVIFKHGQPALLYLVPGVVGCTWLTGLIRGELHEMWIYTEDGSIDTQDVIVEVDADGNVIKEVAHKEDKKDEKDKSGEKSSEKEGNETDGDAKGAKDKKSSGAHDVFLFAITAPGDAEFEDEE
ncbi:uncharacterized protein E0L32_011304 [Thyridium curvatum]|uniref:Signal peptide peptidase n=1 Tax=Thyridium curvatum TaxID=1093900 RepID=A0A507BGA9_9PEZI|nr:uncharacterized protein E0L32_011304 [Thyridium curvatum]TPX18987.1 hypothetical protein E0L32_011304 [Thyridium curvatum]